MSQKKVLVVDDDADVLQSTELLLRLMGYDVVPLSEGKRVTEVATRVKPDVILQDLRMPDLNLEETMKSLQANPDTREIPVVFFSADPEASSKAAEHNVTGVIAKPFQHHELERMLHRIFGDPYLDAEVGGDPKAGKNVQALFHDFWNELSALNNYLAVLGKARVNPALVPAVVRALDQRSLRLAHIADTIQRSVLGVGKI